MRLQGKLSIARPSYGTGKEAIRIECQDAGSAMRVVGIEIGLEDFSRAITGQGDVYCEFEFSREAWARVGKVRQYEQRFIPQPEEYRPTAYEIAAHLARYEKDGWRGNPEDVTNPHRHRGKEVEVAFERWVDPPGGGK